MPVITRLLIHIGLLSVAIAASAGDGYLPYVGPAPLRFLMPASTLAKVTYVLPPLELPPVPSITPETQSLPSPLETNAVTSVQPPELTEPAVTASVTMPGTLFPEPAQNSQPEIGTLTPQMFMHYFTGQHGTNSSGLSIYAPVSFIPPSPVMRPSSSAAFETVPPAKP